MKSYYDVMLDGRFVCQVSTVYPSKHIPEDRVMAAVYQQRPSLRGLDIRVRQSEQRLAR